MDTAAILIGRRAEIAFQLRGQPQCHGHTKTIPKCTTMLRKALPRALPCGTNVAMGTFNVPIATFVPSGVRTVWC